MSWTADLRISLRSRDCTGLRTKTTIRKQTKHEKVNKKHKERTFVISGAWYFVLHCHLLLFFFVVELCLTSTRLLLVIGTSLKACFTNINNIYKLKLCSCFCAHLWLLFPSTTPTTTQEQKNQKQRLQWSSYSLFFSTGLSFLASTTLDSLTFSQRIKLAKKITISKSKRQNNFNRKMLIKALLRFLLIFLFVLHVSCSDRCCHCCCQTFLVSCSLALRTILLPSSRLVAMHSYLLPLLFFCNQSEKYNSTQTYLPRWDIWYLHHFPEQKQNG